MERQQQIQKAIQRWQSGRGGKRTQALVNNYRGGIKGLEATPSERRSNLIAASKREKDLVQRAAARIARGKGNQATVNRLNAVSFDVSKQTGGKDLQSFIDKRRNAADYKGK